MIPLQDSSILIVGLARNCELHINKSVAKLTAAFSAAYSLKFLIIESDSSDQTKSQLIQLSSKIQDFHYLSLGYLQGRYPKRTERIAFCRNQYLNLINNSIEYQDIDYVVVADLDGVNDNLTSTAVSSCWSRSDWDVCAANQYGPYYDIWALRHPLWSPNDCWKQADMMQQLGVNRYTSIYVSSLARMINIPQSHPWIKVSSAFGGLAIYHRSILKDLSYMGLDSGGQQVCEHVSLHDQILRKGGNIFINPLLINAKVVDHAKSATFFGLIRFWLYCQICDLYQSFRLGMALKTLRIK
jgi:hypothetical protein